MGVGRIPVLELDDPGAPSALAAPGWDGSRAAERVDPAETASRGRLARARRRGRWAERGGRGRLELAFRRCREGRVLNDDPTMANDGLALPPIPCRFCAAPVARTVVDLGMSPLCQTIIGPDELEAMEPFYPLHLRVCEACFLVQLPELVAPEDIFGEYPYFSSYSDSWVAHARRYQETMTARLGLGADDLVIEVASNDGYLLQHFRAAGVPVLGIEPAANVARVAEERGIPSRVVFLGAESGAAIAEETGGASLVTGNNVFAHVPDIRTSPKGCGACCAPTECSPSSSRTSSGSSRATSSTRSTTSTSRICPSPRPRRSCGRTTSSSFDVDELPTHGGSLRLYAHRADGLARPMSPSVSALAERELRLGYRTLAPYEGFGQRVAATRRDLLRFLIGEREAGRRVVGYGAPGKSATLLNYCGIRSDLLEYTVDRNPYKQDRYLPGTRIPVYPPERIAATRPDVVLILPWNLRPEIAHQLAYIGEWGGRLAVPIPAVEVFDPPARAGAEAP